jgi:hypothetical protein
MSILSWSVQKVDWPGSTVFFSTNPPLRTYVKGLTNPWNSLAYDTRTSKAFFNDRKYP